MTNPPPSPPGAGPAKPAVTPRQYAASTVKHGLIYFLGNVLARLVGFIMLPVYTRILTAADYGILEILTITADVAGMLAGLGIRSAVMRLYYQYDSRDERNGVVSTASLLLVAIFTALAVAGVVVASWLSNVLLGSPDSALLVKLMVITFIFSALSGVPVVHLQAKQQSAALVSSNVVKLVLALSLNIYFVVYLRIGVQGIFWSTIISTALVGGVMAVTMFRETGVRFVPRHARELIAFGAPLIASQFGSFVLHFSDRYFLRVFHPLSVVGLYALGYKLALLIAMVVDGPFNSIWSAKSLEIASREGERAPPILRSILLNYSLVVVTLSLGVALFATDAVRILLGPDFRDADGPVPLLAVGMVFFCFRHVSQTGAMIAKRPGYIAAVTSGAAITAILLNLLLIPRWGAMGAAGATAGAFGLEFLAMRVLSERAYPIGITLSETLTPLAIATAIWFGASVAVPDDAGLVTGLAVRIAAFGAYVVVLRLSGILSADAQDMLIRSVRDPRAITRALKNA